MPPGGAETGATLMGYDAAGILTWSASGLPASTACSTTGTETAIAARKASRSYDARGRLTGLDFPGGNGDQGWTYTATGLPSQVVTWNDNGSTWATNAYTYNKRRLLTGESQAENDRTYTWSMGYGYDANAHLSTLVYPANLTVAFAPNALGQATKATSDTQIFATNVSYFPNGAIKQFTYGNGMYHTLTQNVRGLPDRSRDNYSTAEVLDDYYDYDQNANVLAITDGVTGSNQRGNRTMTYDGLDRLKTVYSPMWGANLAPASYQYDALDNLTRVTVPATQTAAARDHHYCFDAANRLTNVKTGSCTGSTVIGLGYDVQGNLQNRSGTTYTFDFGNRLRSSAGETHRYDAHGRRLRTSGGAGALYHLYGQGGELYWIRDERDNQRRQFVYLAGSLVAEHTRPIGANTETVTYQHTDALGSPVARTNQARVKVEQSDYEPYGKLANRANDDLPGYTGHVMDATSGLTYMQQRYYDPALGMFLSVDPVTAFSDPVGQFNRYRYANDNPYKFTDPDGRWATPDTAVDAGFVIYDSGKFLGAAAATIVGVITGNEALQSVGLEGMRDTGTDLGASLSSAAIPGLAAPVARGVVKGAEAAADATAATNRTENIARGIPESQLGPSGKPKIHTVDHGGQRGRAKEAARRENGKGGRTENHTSPKVGKDHYHGVSRDGDKSVVHHEYDK